MARGGFQVLPMEMQSNSISNRLNAGVKIVFSGFTPIAVFEK
jgi:hypothetical protein